MTSRMALGLGREWPLYDQNDLDRRRGLLRTFLDSDDAKDIVGDVRSVLPARHFGGDADHLGVGRHNTELAYQGDQRSYIAASLKAGIDPLAPTVEFWTDYFTSRAATDTRTGMKPRISTLNRNAAGIANLFHQHGLPSPTRTFAHKRLIRRLARCDDRTEKKAKPLYGHDVRLLLDASEPAVTLHGSRDRAMYAIGVARGFRAATIVGLCLENLTFDAKGVVMGLRDEKTSRTRALQFTATRHTRNHRACMPCILKSHVDLLRTLGITEGPVFRRVDQWGHMGDKGLSTKSVTAILRKGLRKAGVANPDEYSSHSFRHGVVKTGIVKGWSLPDIMLVTLHRSLAGLRAYVEGIDPWYSAPRRSVLDGDLAAASAPGRGWKHVE